MSEQKPTPVSPESEGEGTDGRGSPGIVQEKTADQAEPSAFEFEDDEPVREARAGETGTTRFGMEGSDTDGPGSRGILDEPPVEDEEDLEP